MEFKQIILNQNHFTLERLNVYLIGVKNSKKSMKLIILVNCLKKNLKQEKCLDKYSLKYKDHRNHQ